MAARTPVGGEMSLISYLMHCKPQSAAASLHKKKQASCHVHHKTRHALKPSSRLCLNQCSRDCMGSNICKSSTMKDIFCLYMKREKRHKGLSQSNLCICLLYAEYMQ